MEWIKQNKVVVVIIAVVFLGIALSGKEDNSKSPQTASDAKSSTVKKDEPSSKPSIPSYELIGEYGQDGQVYLISPSDANEEKLTLIGKDLNSKFGGKSFVRIGIYTDRTQAKLMADDPGAVMGLEGDAAAAYDQAYVAQFNVNKNTGLKEFILFPSRNSKEIKL